jgi:hypothetical protein
MGVPKPSTRTFEEKKNNIRVLVCSRKVPSYARFEDGCAQAFDETGGAFADKVDEEDDSHLREEGAVVPPTRGIGRWIRKGGLHRRGKQGRRRTRRSEKRRRRREKRREKRRRRRRRERRRRERRRRRRREKEEEEKEEEENEEEKKGKER